MENNQQPNTIGGFAPGNYWRKECKTCKQSGLTNFQKGSVILGLYILISAIYGTVEFIKDIISYFKHVY